ncbi:hypothetical protein LINPERPRIM_LOCUS29521 [Linum perenne]
MSRTRSHHWSTSTF